LGCLSVIRLPQSFACQRSLVEVRPAIPVCILVGSVGLCVRAGLSGASDPWRSSAAIRILRGSVVVQTSLVPSREYTLQTVRFRVNNAATIKLTHYRTLNLVMYFRAPCHRDVTSRRVSVRRPLKAYLPRLLGSSASPERAGSLPFLGAQNLAISRSSSRRSSSS
jgi:hypothetical protein